MNCTRSVTVSVAVCLLGVIGCSPNSSPTGQAMQPLAGSAPLPQLVAGARAPSPPVTSAAVSGTGGYGASAGSAAPSTVGRVPSAAGASAGGSAVMSGSAAPAGAAGTAAPASASAPSVTCLALRSCCSAVLDTRAKTLCQTIADGSNESLCKVASDDYCATSSVPAPPAGTPPVAGTADCSALATCCNTLEDEDDQEDCEEVVDAAVATDCRTSLSELCPTTTTPTTPSTPSTPTTGACATLDTQCCATLDDDDDLEECKDAVSTADATACQEAHEALCGSGGDD